jgi:hypothetical protein
MRHKNLAFGTAAILVFAITLTALLTTSYSAIETINPVAALTAITVAIIGITWFKKTR